MTFLSIIILAACFLLALPASARAECKFLEGWDFYVFGINKELITKATKGEILEFGAGFGASLFTHIGSHWLMAKLDGTSYDLSGFYEHVHSDASPAQTRRFYQAGFFGQTLVTTVLTAIPSTRQTYFVKGFVAGTDAELWSYNAIWNGDSGDFRMSDKYGGNSGLEFSVETLVSIHNTLRVSWKKDMTDKNSIIP